MKMYSSTCGQTPAQCDLGFVVIPRWLLMGRKPRRAAGNNYIEVLSDFFRSLSLGRCDIQRGEGEVCRTGRSILLLLPDGEIIVDEHERSLVHWKTLDWLRCSNRMFPNIR